MMRPRGQNLTGQALRRALIARLDKLHLEPGDFLTVEFPKELYDSPAAFRDAQRFVDGLANLTQTHVIILREGVRVAVQSPTGAAKGVIVPGFEL